MAYIEWSRKNAQSSIQHNLAIIGNKVMQFTPKCLEINKYTKDRI